MGSASLDHAGPALNSLYLSLSAKSESLLTLSQDTDGITDHLPLATLLVLVP